ncbi:MAG: META domain-containing protein [Desulfosarcina sp.]|nr:META domain-containing protein [Desulfobacterales bacterium]
MCFNHPVNYGIVVVLLSLTGCLAGGGPGVVSTVDETPAGPTKMACPDPDMAVENRFLGQLGRIHKFGFQMGKLALYYRQDDHPGVMLFEGRRPRSGD